MLCTSVDSPSSSWTLPELDMFSLDSVNQMALDWASGNWYFLDDSREMILLCSLRSDDDANDGERDNKFLCKTVVSVHVSKPRGIALDPNAGLMFFSVWGASDTAKIERAQLVSIDLVMNRLSDQIQSNVSRNRLLHDDIDDN